MWTFCPHKPKLNKFLTHLLSLTKQIEKTQKIQIWNLSSPRKCCPYVAHTWHHVGDCSGQSLFQSLKKEWSRTNDQNLQITKKCDLYSKNQALSTSPVKPHVETFSTFLIESGKNQVHARKPPHPASVVLNPGEGQSRHNLQKVCLNHWAEVFPLPHKCWGTLWDLQPAMTHDVTKTEATHSWLTSRVLFTTLIGICVMKVPWTVGFWVRNPSSNMTPRTPGQIHNKMLKSRTSRTLQICPHSVILATTGYCVHEKNATHNTCFHSSVTLQNVQIQPLEFVVLATNCKICLILPRTWYLEARDCLPPPQMLLGPVPLPSPGAPKSRFAWDPWNMSQRDRHCSEPTWQSSSSWRTSFISASTNMASPSQRRIEPTVLDATFFCCPFWGALAVVIRAKQLAMLSSCSHLLLKFLPPIRIVSQSTLEDRVRVCSLSAGVGVKPKGTPVLKTCRGPDQILVLAPSHRAFARQQDQATPPGEMYSTRTKKHLPFGPRSSTYSYSYVENEIALQSMRFCTPARRISTSLQTQTLLFARILFEKMIIPFKNSSIMQANPALIGASWIGDAHVLLKIFPRKITF